MNGSEKKLCIFISHNHKDADKAAEIIKNTLLLYGGGRFRFLLSKDLPPDHNWHHWIKETIGQANIILFLCTNLNESWEWCLYEAGIFQGLKDESEGHLIILHSPAVKPPLPLADLPAIAAKPEPMKKFLKQLFDFAKMSERIVPITETFIPDEQTLTNIANKICHLFD